MHDIKEKEQTLGVQRVGTVKAYGYICLVAVVLSYLLLELYFYIMTPRAERLYASLHSSTSTLNMKELAWFTLIYNARVLLSVNAAFILILIFLLTAHRKYLKAWLLAYATLLGLVFIYYHLCH